MILISGTTRFRNMGLIRGLVRHPKDVCSFFITSRGPASVGGVVSRGLTSGGWPVPFPFALPLSSAFPFPLTLASTFASTVSAIFTSPYDDLAIASTITFPHAITITVTTTVGIRPGRSTSRPAAYNRLLIGRGWWRWTLRLRPGSPGRCWRWKFIRFCTRPVEP